MTRRRAVVGVMFLGLLTLFGGQHGALAGVLILVVWGSLGFPRGVLWVSSVALMGATPIAILVQGLPSGAVIGGGFGVRHLVAHVLVGLSLALALLATMDELLMGVETPGGLSRSHPPEADGAAGSVHSPSSRGETPPPPA